MSQIDHFVQLYQTKYQNWKLYVKKATESLNEWSTIVPQQAAYEEEIRRLLMNDVIKFSSLLLSQSVHVEADHHGGRKPPAHYLGTGPIDFILGGPAVVCCARDAVVGENDIADILSAVEQNIGLDATENAMLNDEEVMSRLVGRTSVEEKVLLDAFALFQLAGECHDHAFVSEALQRTVANRAAVAKTAGLRRRLIDRALAQESSPTGTGQPQREFHSVSGILTTGQTWEVFEFSTTTLDVSEKPRIKYLGPSPIRLYFHLKAGQTRVWSQ